MQKVERTRRINAYIECVIRCSVFKYKVREKRTFPNMCECFPLLRTHEALYPLQFSFSYASMNFSFKGIFGDPLTTFNFTMSFFLKKKPFDFNMRMIF